MVETTDEVTQQHERRLDTAQLAGDGATVDYEPYPENSIKVGSEHQHIIQCITNLYSGSHSEDDMRVYAEKAIYDDPYSYCDTRYKIAGQWYGLPKLFGSLKSLGLEVVKDEPSLIVYKQRHEYTLKGVGASHAVDSLISLSLDEDGKVKYHKDQWNQKDYSHKGIGMVMKTLNGDHLTKITQPEESLKISGE